MQCNQMDFIINKRAIESLISPSMGTQESMGSCLGYKDEVKPGKPKYPMSNESNV